MAKTTSRAFVKALLGTAPDAIIAKQCGVSHPTVSRWRREAGVQPFRWRMRGVYANRLEKYLAVLSAHPDGVRAVEIAKILGVSPEAVRTMLLRLLRRHLVVYFVSDDMPRVLWRKTTTHEYRQLMTNKGDKE